MKYKIIPKQSHDILFPRKRRISRVVRFGFYAVVTYVVLKMVLVALALALSVVSLLFMAVALAVIFTALARR